jgi:hypothetical protein
MENGPLWVHWVLFGGTAITVLIALVARTIAAVVAVARQK